MIACRRAKHATWSGSIRCAKTTPRHRKGHPFSVNWKSGATSPPSSALPRTSAGSCARALLISRRVGARPGSVAGTRCRTGPIREVRLRAARLAGWTARLRPRAARRSRVRFPAKAELALDDPQACPGAHRHAVMTSEPRRHRPRVPHVTRAHDRKPLGQFGSVAQGTVERRPQPLCSCTVVQHPWRGPKGWVVTNMLAMKAVQQCYPVTGFVLHELDDVAFHAPPLCAPKRAQRDGRRWRHRQRQPSRVRAVASVFGMIASSNCSPSWSMARSTMWSSKMFMST